MNPLIKRTEKKSNKLSTKNNNSESDMQMSKLKNIINNFDKSEKSKTLGVFYKINHIKEFIPEYQVKYYNTPFYFKEYDKKDGEWINKGDILCYVDTAAESLSGSPIYSPKSGYLEHTKESGAPLSENDELSKIHDKGEYINENSPDKSEFFHYSSNLSKWLVADGEFVKENDNIYQSQNFKHQIENHKAKKKGYIDICHYKTLSIYSNLENQKKLLCVIRDDDSKRINQKYINKPKIIIDDFSNTKIIEWENVSISLSIYLKKGYQGVISKSDNFFIDLLFTFNFINGNDYIIFHFNPKQIKPKSNDIISFLFENDEKIDFSISNNPIFSKNNRNEKIVEVKSLITKSELELFAKQKFKKWKINLFSNGKYILGGNTGEENNYKTKSNLIIVINKFTNEYIKLISKEIKNYKPIEERELVPTSTNKPNKDEICYVYLMHDTTNNFYKIGISNNPKYRERTLQSEKPTIELIISKRFPIRKIAESFEKALHETYSDQRIRGEWFDLSEKDVENIKLSLK